MADLNIVAIVQARMKSNRLPGKILKEIAGIPMLERVVERAKRSHLIRQVVVATTEDPSDDGVEEFCTQKGYQVYRGSLHDVLDRFYQTARYYKADVVVRFTADCPLLDPELIDYTLTRFLESGVDFAANRLPPPFTRTYPIGLDTEICTFNALARAWKEAELPYEREHVMPYLYDTPGRFKILRVEYEKDYSHMRWTVDTAEDLELVNQIYARFANHPDFNWLDVLAIFVEEPELADINSKVKHKTYLDFDERRNKKSE